MKKLLLLLWLPSVAFSSIMYTAPGVTAEDIPNVADAVSGYAGASSWSSLWEEMLAAQKASGLGLIGPSVANIPATTVTGAGTSSALGNNGTSAAYEFPAAIAASPEPGTWSLLAVSAIPGLFALYRRRTKQPLTEQSY